MPLDPLVKAFLDQASAMPRPKMWEVPLSITRQGFAHMMSMMGPKDVPVGKVQNIAIPGPAGEIRARRLFSGRGGRRGACRRWSISMAAALWWAIWKPMTGFAA